jgi:hypothetical protein
MQHRGGARGGSEKTVEARCRQERVRACRADGGRRGAFLADCPLVQIAGSILGRHRNPDRDAINAWRGIDRLKGPPGWNGAGRRRGSAAGNLCRVERIHVWCGPVRVGSALRNSAHRAKRLSICGDHAGDCHADCAHPARVDHRHSPVRRNVGRNRGWIDTDRRVAGISAHEGLNCGHLTHYCPLESTH